MAELKQLDCSEDLRFVLHCQLQAYEQAQALLAKCDSCLAKVCRRRHNKNEIKILCTVPGIGEKSALDFVLEMGSTGRFLNRLEVSKYQGLAPEVKASGDTRRELRLNESGNRRLKTLLVEAAWRWVGNDEKAAQLYSRMLHNTGCAQKAITAVARKLGIILWRMRETSTPYSPDKKDRQPKG